MQFNRITIAGYVAADAEARNLPSGTKVMNLLLGESWTMRRNGGEERHVNWHRLVFYGRQADLAESYKQGDNILVEGKFQQRKYTAKDGEEYTAHEVLVQRTMQLAGRLEPQDTVTEEVEVEVWPA